MPLQGESRDPNFFCILKQSTMYSVQTVSSGIKKTFSRIYTKKKRPFKWVAFFGADEGT